MLAKREHPEKWYQERWCRAQGGQVEAVLPDKTRCDCVTDTHAIEFDFGNQLTTAINMRPCLCFNYSTNKFDDLVKSQNSRISIP